MERQENEGCSEIDFAETISHLGGRGLAGALAYTGTRRVEHTERRLRLYVSGKRGHTYYVTITVSVLDLYDIELWGQRGDKKQLLGQQADLDFFDLQGAVETLYDRVMNETNGGYIPLG
jgi:hypothetical protein